MVARPETLSARVGAALTGVTDTGDLATLYYECYGQPCAQRGRILHFLTLFIKRNPIPQAVPAAKVGKGRNPLLITTMPYQFKDAFKDISVIVNGTEGPKEVHAGNLTDEDAELIIADGKGHLLQPVTADEAAAAVKVAAPMLSTRTAGGEYTPDGSDVDKHEIAEATARANQAANEAEIELAEYAPPVVTVAPIIDPTAPIK